jgi:hypothetical protein
MHTANNDDAMTVDTRCKRSSNHVHIATILYFSM